MLVKTLLLALAVLFFSVDSEPKVESTGALSGGGVSDAVRGTLEAKGQKVFGTDGKPVAEVWFRKDIPSGSAAVDGANFASRGGDYRGQGIKPGYYTLRYGLILVDGNHLGVSPARDFLIACPVSDDKDPNATLKPEDVIKLSKAASGTNHPSVWCMVPPTATSGLPRAIKDGSEHVILETVLTTKSGPIPIGLILVGKTEG
jgi:hypothetical protein